jgi:drug/metabolite transporter (DMT)-like permease
MSGMGTTAGADPRAAALRGVAWMAAASLFFSILAACARGLGQRYPSFELVMFQSAVTVACMTVWAVRSGASKLRSPRPGVHAVRAIAAFAGMAAMFFALRRMALADATAFLFTTPLFTVLIVSAVMHERVGVRRGLAILAGFAGALVIVRPGFAEVSWPILFAALSALGFGVVNATTRLLARTDDPNAMVFIMYAAMLAMSAPWAIAEWRPPQAADLPVLLLMGVATVCAQQCITRAISIAPPAVVMPAHYLQLPFAAVIGYAAFAEVPDVWIWGGAAIIAGATYYIVRIESRR